MKEKNTRYLWLKDKLLKWCNYIHTDNKGKIILEDKYTPNFIEYIHCKSAHAGRNAYYYNIKDYYKINNIQKVIKEVLLNCKSVNITKKKEERIILKLK